MYTFSGGSDGAHPSSSLVIDDRGNLYGTAPDGGASGYGTVFRLAPDGTFSVLHSFTGGKDGANPGPLISGKKRKLYGTAFNGGSAGYGTVFMLDE